MQLGSRASRAVVAVLAFVAVASVAPVGAAPATEAGYWWRAKPVSGIPVSPPGVDDGQLYVAADGVGIEAVAALRGVVGAANPQTVVITLREASADVAEGIIACPTEGWTAPDGAGAFPDRPSEARCAEEGIDGVRSDDGTWQFRLVGSVVVGGIVDVVLVPQAPLDVVFEAPDASTISSVSETPPNVPPPAAASAPTPPTQAAPPRSSTAPPIVAAPGATDTFVPAPPPAGTPTDAFDDDVVALPAPVPASLDDLAEQAAGRRAPAALLAVALIAAAWIYRTRAALAAAPAHVLAQPLRGVAGGAAAAAAETIADRRDDPESDNAQPDNTGLLPLTEGAHA